MAKEAAAARPSSQLEPGSEVVLATRNRGKVEELNRLLRDAPWHLIGLDDAPGGSGLSWDETGSTYQQNAAIKALAAARATGRAALADDSGLELGALGGFPGVRTARWLGEDASPAELLAGIAARVAQLPPESRQAIFVCVLCLALPDQVDGWSLIYAEGRVEGALLSEPRGGGGFGYDPIFIPVGQTLTMAEMPQPQKERLSHRGRAARELLRLLEEEERGTPGELGPRSLASN